MFIIVMARFEGNGVWKSGAKGIQSFLQKFFSCKFRVKARFSQAIRCSSPIHEQDRRELTVQVGLLLSKDNIIATMLNSPDSYDRIASFIKKAIKTKEEKERNEKKRLIEIQLPKRTSPTEVILKRSSGGC